MAALLVSATEVLVSGVGFRVRRFGERCEALRATVFSWIFVGFFYFAFLATRTSPHIPSELCNSVGVACKA
jgi:hypothetical protein